MDEAIERLLDVFPGSFINDNNELILIPKTNTYFLIDGCNDERDLIAKVLMWCSRVMVKGIPYRSDLKNKSFRIDRINNLNFYLDTNFTQEDVELIYQKLGNAINPELTYQFIDSGFDLGVLGGRR